MDKNHSFASRLSWGVVFISSSIFIIALAVVAIFGGTVMKIRSTDYMTEFLKSSILDIESEFDQAEAITQGIAFTIEEYQRMGSQLDTARTFNLMERTVLSSPYIMGMGLYFEPERYIKGQKWAGIYVNIVEETNELIYEWDSDESFARDGWDYFTEDWYANIRLSCKPGWTPPFSSFMEGGGYELMTTYSYPLIDDKGEFFGVATLDFKLSWLKEKLLAIRPYDNSNVTLIDENMNIICNPMSDTPFEGSALETPLIPGMKFTFKGTEKEWQGDDQVSTMKVHENGRGAYCIIGKMSHDFWVLITCQYSEVYADMIHLWLALLGVAVLGMLLLYFFSHKVINNETAPISKFAEAASKITDGHFDIPIPEVTSEDEIQDLGNALSYMQSSVTSYIAELRTTMASKQRLENELDVARKIQTQMLSTDFPIFKNIELYASSTPAKQVGGDLYDFFVTDSGVYFIVGDVSGKGVPAALLMAISIAAFRASGKKGHTSEEIVSLINDTFCRSNEDMMFVTLVVGHIDSETNVMEFCNAGHNPMVLINPQGEASLMKEKTNVACGVMPRFPYVGERIQLEHGSRLLVYSDGITEAENNIKELYGESRLLDWAKANSTKRINNDKAVVDSLSVSVSNFTKGAEQNDDMTIMSISV